MPQGHTHRSSAPASVEARVRTWRDGGWTVRPDHVVAEEPLEIRLEHEGENRALAVTMRTPGDDLALAAGFLLSEGIVDRREDLVEVRPCLERAPDGSVQENIVQALLAPGRSFDWARFTRHVYTTSSCGVCGKASLEALEVSCSPARVGHPVVEADTLLRLPQRLRDAQGVFADTGGLHASALFSAEGELLDVAEDVGRHNATDKVIGRALMSGRVPLLEDVLVVSGRVSFEIVQKAARAQIAVVAAIGAPSSLAVETAKRFGITVVGFLGPQRFNVYSATGRVRGLSCVVPGEGP